MELTRHAHIVLAFMVGFWSLAAQFIFNRIIFFYIANSEYVAASIISIHLAGFWLGTLLFKRWPVPVQLLIALTITVTMAANIIVWRIGAGVIGLPLTVFCSVVCGLILAALSGALVVRLMDDEVNDGRGVVIADSAGSVIGAVLGGFILIPKLGLTGTFALILFAQSLTLLWALWHLKLGGRAALFFALPAIAALMISIHAPPVSSNKMIVIDGLPVERLSAREGTVMHSEQSPYGLITVLRLDAESRMLMIDNRPLCISRAKDLDGLSEWVVGSVPMQMIKHSAKENLRIANVGLGCGVTVAAILKGLNDQGRLDIVEINPNMPDAQRKFWPDLPHTPDDTRVNMIIDDGYRYFAELRGQPLYHAVVIDTAWMQNMNATHLFSKEMYENIAKNLDHNGILAIWSEETNPFSAVSLIMYRTLREVFPHVVVDATPGVVLFYASTARSDLVNFLSEEAGEQTAWINEVGMMAPVNQLDDLVMNRHKFTLFGDSTYDRLFKKY